MREHLGAGFLLLAGIGCEPRIIMRSDHLQRDAVFDRIFRRRLDIDAGLAAFAALSAFTTLAAGARRHRLQQMLRRSNHDPRTRLHLRPGFQRRPILCCGGQRSRAAAGQNKGADADPDFAILFHDRSHQLTRLPRANTHNPLA